MQQCVDVAVVVAVGDFGLIAAGVAGVLVESASEEVAAGGRALLSDAPTGVRLTRLVCCVAGDAVVADGVGESYCLRNNLIQSYD